MSCLDTGPPARTMIHHNSTNARGGICVKPRDESGVTPPQTLLESPLFLGGWRDLSAGVARAGASRRKTREPRLPREIGNGKKWANGTNMCVSLTDQRESPRVCSAPLTQLHLLLAFMCSLCVKLVFILFVLHLCSQRVRLAGSPLDFYSISLLINTLKSLFEDVGPQIPPATFCV